MSGLHFSFFFFVLKSSMWCGASSASLFSTDLFGLTYLQRRLLEGKLSALGSWGRHCAGLNVASY